jgi:DNA repair protein RecN (Recombination protein N)
MLETLYIENVAVIEKAEINFTNGFNILTGETGAGKSIIIDSLNLLLGQRASRDMIRTGADRAFVSAVFSISAPKLKEILAARDIYPDDDGNLLIERSFRQDGHGTAKINGRPVSVTLLKELAERLVTIHGQHMNQQIMNPASHISYIDNYGNYTQLLREYHELYREVTVARKELLRLQRIAAEKTERQDILAYRVQELKNANLTPGEEEHLLEKRNAASHAEKITDAISQTLDRLSDREHSAYDLMLQSKNELDHVSQYAAPVRDCVNILNEILPALEEGINTLRNAQNAISYEPGELDTIEHRLSLIKRIKAKYGGTVESALRELAVSQKELDELDLSEENLAKQDAVFQELAGKLAEKSKDLTAARIACSKQLSKAIMEKLAFLDMERCQFTVSITPSEKYTALGHDTVEFFMSANPGESPKPLAKIASGGELSRIMLSIIHALSEKDRPDTMIFDEVDSGVSGKTAQKIGVLLKEVSRQSQVLCVTHLAQIAAMADNHLLITKKAIENQTFTQVSQLDHEGRRREVARIVGGINITETTLNTADELIAAGNL